MGLTKEVRDFFTGRINRVLDAKLRIINDQIDQKQVSKQTLEKVCVQAGIPSNSLTRFEKIQEEQNALKKEEQELRSMLYAKAVKEFPNKGVYTYHEDVIEELKNLAAREFGDEILAKDYPQLVEEIAKIKLVKENVESVVLLSTSEIKLVERLTQVLQKYGGDIPEILKYIPE